MVNTLPTLIPLVLPLKLSLMLKLGLVSKITQLMPE
jgi:hypothetical protein